MRRRTILVRNNVYPQRRKAWKSIMNKHVSVVLTIDVLVIEKLWPYNLFFGYSTPNHNTWAVQKWLVTFSWTLSTPNLHILLVYWTIETKNTLSENTIFDKHSEYPLGWFWQCLQNCNRLNLSLLRRPWKFCIFVCVQKGTSLKCGPWLYERTVMWKQLL